MKISASGFAKTALNCLKKRRNLQYGRDCISCLHDALLAVAKGIITPEEVKGFFFDGNTNKADFIGGVLEFTEEELNKVRGL